MTAEGSPESAATGIATDEPTGSGLIGRVERRSVRLTIQLAFFMLFLALAAVLSGVLVALVGGSPTAVLDALLDGSLRSPGAWGRSLIEMVPLALVGLGVVVAFKAGSYNIGQEGQLAMGALGATVVSLLVPGPAGLIMALSLIAAAAAGGVWAGIAAVAEARRKVDVLISTLLLTFVAPNLILFLVSRDYLLLDTTESNNRLASQSERVPEELRLIGVEIVGNEIHVGVLVTLVVTALVAVLLARSVWGLRLRMLGLSGRTARRAGVRPGIVGGGALVFSGAAAGLGGGMLLIGAAFRLRDQIANDFGWHGLLVALVARLNPVAVLPVAFFFAMVRTGGGFLTATGVSRTVTDAVQAIFVVAALLPAALMFVRDRRVARRMALRSVSATAP